MDNYTPITVLPVFFESDYRKTNFFQRDKPVSEKNHERKTLLQCCLIISDKGQMTGAVYVMRYKVQDCTSLHIW